MKINSAYSPQWADVGNTAINLTVDFDGLCPVPFTANPEDREEAGRELYTRALAGDFGEVAPYVAPPLPAPVVPGRISMRQARLVLLSAGLLDTVNAAVTGLPRAEQIEWEYATEVRRDSSLVARLAQAINLSGEQLDDLFTQASKM